MECERGRREILRRPFCFGSNSIVNCSQLVLLSKRNILCSGGCFTWGDIYLWVCLKRRQMSRRISRLWISNRAAATWLDFCPSSAVPVGNHRKKMNRMWSFPSATNRIKCNVQFQFGGTIVSVTQTELELQVLQLDYWKLYCS